MGEPPFPSLFAGRAVTDLRGVLHRRPGSRRAVNSYAGISMLPMGARHHYLLLPRSLVLPSPLLSIAIWNKEKSHVNKVDSKRYSYRAGGPLAVCEDV